jgi:hypothetical protein
MSNAGKRRIWDVAEPGALVASLFGADGAPIGEYDLVEPVELKASYVACKPGQFPEGALFASDRLRGRLAA